MRFNDMIATVLAASAERPEAREAQWRQLVDLLAQRQPGAPDAARAEAFAFLRDERAMVEPRVRAAAAASLAGLAIDPDLVAFFAEDRAEIAAPLLRSVRLGADDWLGILPRLGPTARALLRHRRDLPRDVRRALAAFGPSDLVLGQQLADPGPQPADSPRGEAGSPILELVERIEAYQRQRREPAPEPEAASYAAPAAAFRWEAGTEGVIRWVDGAPRGPLIGLSIAAPADAARPGVDDEASRAFERRTPFRDAQLRVAGQGEAAGDWRASGVPFFDAARGAFLGYRGAARRGGTAEMPSATFGPALPPDSLRQLIHELRTPLNAIMGFAELIEGQYMGPAADRYRHRAADIMDHASRLLGTVDDLDTAARIETRRLAETAGRSDAAALLERLRQSYDNAARQRGARFDLTVAPDLPEAAVAPDVTERLLARMLAATIGLAREGEEIAAALRADREMLDFAIDRPQAVEGLDAQALLDPAFSPAGDWPAAPALGLGFALRLVRNLAEAAGGELVIGAERIQLRLPAAPAA
ncbi:histidine kinase dimerization/phospho-acceptor domain-containing protein [Sphingosinicella sp.]|uniref:histidine kinase dimerization/phospho-acceptor domain-containing protein n=1 Tax=Sphingosinicella sp. TaxID=1917971 RepID=UPI0040376399